LGKGIVGGINGTSSDQGLVEVHGEPLAFAEDLEDLLGRLCNFRSDSISGEESDVVGILLGDGIEAGGNRGAKGRRGEGGGSGQNGCHGEGGGKLHD